MNSWITIALEVLAWPLIYVLFATIYLIFEDARLARFALTRKRAPDELLDEKETKHWLTYISKKWQLLWLIPALLATGAFVMYRQIVSHPTESLVGLKVCVVLLVLAYSAFQLRLMNYGITSIHGTGKEAATKKDGFAVDPQKLQGGLRSCFLKFMSSLIFAGLLGWWLFN